MSETRKPRKKAELRAETIRVRSEEMEWLAANRGWLERQHAGEWVAVQGSVLVAANKDLQRVMQESQAKGIDHPLLTAIPKKDYQGVIVVRSPRIDR